MSRLDVLIKVLENQLGIKNTDVSTWPTKAKEAYVRQLEAAEAL